MDKVVTGYGQEVFRDVDVETRRLTPLGDFLDTSSRRHLQALGLSRGWRCLEIGPGAGTLTRWVGQKVEPGAVVAVDRDTRVFGDAHGSNVDVVCADVCELDDVLVNGEPLGEFDLVYARLVLMHLPERRRVLEKMVRRLRPGGHLLVSDALAMPCRTREARGAVNLFWEEAKDRLGTDPHWAASYPDSLAACGLHSVNATVDVPVLHGDSAYAFFMGSSLWQLTADSTGAVPAVAKAWLSMLEDVTHVEWPFAVVTAWGTRAIE